MTIAIHMRNGNVRLVILIANAGLLRIYPSTRSFVPNTACLQSSLLALCIRIDNDVFFPETPKDGVANGVIVTYPALFLRIKAMLLDSVLFALLVLTTVICVGSLSIEALPLKAALILLPILLFEPMFIWLTGGSIGHHYAGIRIASVRTGKNLFLFGGVVRLIVKLTAGWASLLTLFITRKHRSVHDLASGSIVLFKNESAVPAHYQRKERDLTVRPSIYRRLIVIAATLILALFVLGLVVGLLLSGKCIEFNRCSEQDQFLMTGLAVLTLVAMPSIVVLGLVCKLPGAFYRKPHSIGADAER